MVTSREMSYSDDSASTYGQVKAAATGDILLLEHANVSLSADAYERLHASFKRARERDKQEASAIRGAIDTSERYLQRYQQIQRECASYKGEHPFMTPSRQLLAEKEAQSDFMAERIKSAIERDTHSAQRIVDFQGVSIFFMLGTCTLVFDDPYEGVGVSCPAGWLEDGNRRRFAGKIRHFFENLSTEIEKQAGAITERRQKVEEFEQSAQAIFPHQEAWQQTLSRKRALDAYIHLAAHVTSHEDHAKLAGMRKRLLDTAPKELTERPKPKHTATCVLPPRRPETPTAPIPLEETRAKVSATQVEPLPVTIPPVVVVTRESQEKADAPTKAVPVQSKSRLLFGSTEHIKQGRSRSQAQKPAKAATPPQAPKSEKESEPVPVSAPLGAKVVPGSQEKADAPTKAVPIQSKSRLLFGSTEHIKQGRSRRSVQKPAKAATPPQALKSEEESEPVAVSAPPVAKVVLGSQEKADAPTKAVPVQSKSLLVLPVPVPVPPVVKVAPEQTESSTKAVPVQSKSLLVFGNTLHIEQARKRPQAQKPAEAATPPQAAKSKEELKPVPVPVPPAVSVAPEQAEAPTKAVPVQSKSPAFVWEHSAH